MLIRAHGTPVIRSPRRRRGSSPKATDAPGPPVRISDRSPVRWNSRNRRRLSADRCSRSKRELSMPTFRWKLRSAASPGGAIGPGAAASSAACASGDGGARRGRGRRRRPAPRRGCPGAAARHAGESRAGRWAARPSPRQSRGRNPARSRQTPCTWGEAPRGRRPACPARRVGPERPSRTEHGGRRRWGGGGSVSAGRNQQKKREGVSRCFS